MIRRWLILCALGCTLLACWWVEQAEQSPEVIAGPGSTRMQRRVTLAQALPAARVVSEVIIQPVPAVYEEEGVNLFEAMPTPAAEIAEAQAIAPVSPYTYAGRLQEEGRWTVFLTDGQQQYVLHEGDRFAEGWKVAVLDQEKVVLQHATGRFEIRLDNGVVF
ncbi:MAG TPA: hypothetical protein VK958_08295 [Methylophilus sp.]|uniref:hypothetical protein n=1 Tax=Methylophilus sp. TaxID=29541 RepID=UPI002CFCAA51|nr:hypothetical protein [Methylophilus sp.]HSH87230.1 hypothetical protein [Methylophilus sp.]